MLDLAKGARSDEHFHLQTGPPVLKVMNLFVVKRVTWTNVFLEDGTPGYFISWWIFGNAIHWYHGNVKCDGTRTRSYWNGELDDEQAPHYTPDPTQYVMTTTEKEKVSVRLFVDPGEPAWDGMGGS